MFQKVKSIVLWITVFIFILVFYYPAPVHASVFDWFSFSKIKSLFSYSETENISPELAQILNTVKPESKPTEMSTSTQATQNLVKQIEAERDYWKTKYQKLNNAYDDDLSQVYNDLSQAKDDLSQRNKDCVAYATQQNDSLNDWQDAYNKLSQDYASLQQTTDQFLSKLETLANEKLQSSSQNSSSPSDYYSPPRTDYLDKFWDDYNKQKLQEERNRTLKDIDTNLLQINNQLWEQQHRINTRR